LVQNCGDVAEVDVELMIETSWQNKELDAIRINGFRVRISKARGCLTSLILGGVHRTVRIKIQLRFEVEFASRKNADMPRSSQIAKDHCLVVLKETRDCTK